MSKPVANSGKSSAQNDGIVNSSGAVVMAAAPLYLAMVPLTTWLARSDGIAQNIGRTAISVIPSGPTSITTGRLIPAFSAIYLFWTFGASGAISAAGQGMGRADGLDNNEPRRFVHSLTGLPLRMRSAHYALMENFPAFALAAALAQVLAPKDQVVVNLLGLHVLLKLFVHYPAYILNIAPPRTFAHIAANAALINVCWRLAIGA